MKKSCFFTFAIAFALLLSSCGGNTPEDVTDNFRKAILKADVEEASRLSVIKKKETAIPFIMAMATDERVKKALAEPLEKADIKEDTARVESKSLYFVLKKVDGKWFVENMQKKSGSSDKPPKHEIPND